MMLRQSRHPAELRTEQNRFRQNERNSVLRMLALTMALAGAAYLGTRHANHALQYLPYLILLICPLTHLFHHRHRQH
jgi:hypothetical protein